MTRPDHSRLFWILGAIAFTVLATANGAGYRFSASDQAFYVPAVLRAADPGAFPRDGALLDAQSRLMVLDEALASLLRTTGLSLEALFLAGYLLSVLLLWSALVLIGRRVCATWWATAALAAAFTLRHRIPRTSANSLEPYFHPRMLAFALGMLAVAALLRRRSWTTIALVGTSALVHVTTGLWFAVLLGVALAVLDPAMRRLAYAGGAVAVALAAVAGATGRLSGSLAPMDDVWLAAVASKDSLFATTWPPWAWAANGGLLVLLWVAHRARQARGSATREDEALVWGATALVGLFVVTLPLVAARATLPVQLQIPRVFWLVDALALVYVVASLAEILQAREANGPVWKLAPMLLACLLLDVSIARGVYVMLVERPDRALFAVTVPPSPWEDAMAWLARQPRDAHVLADPGHAWKYGTSVRASAGRDVLLEEVKDSAMAIYSRAVAERVVERTSAIGSFASLTPDALHALAARYDLDYLVSESELRLPLAYRNDQFRVYRLQAPAHPDGAGSATPPVSPAPASRDR